MQPPDNVVPPQFPLTPAEREKFKNCLDEFSYASSLPFIISGGIAGYIGPYLLGKVRTGIVCSTIGMFGGIAYAKYAHVKKCFGKMMMNPSFASRYRAFVENSGMAPVGAVPPRGAMPPAWSYQPAPEIPKTEEYVDQNEIQQPDMTPTIDQTFDTMPLFSEDINTRKDKFFDQDKELDSIPFSSTRYDELRRKNREEYYRNQRQVTQPYTPLPPTGQTQEVPQEVEPEKYPKMTKYGDVWA